MATATKILDRVKVREVAGVSRSRDVLDTAVQRFAELGFRPRGHRCRGRRRSTRKVGRRESRPGGIAGGTSRSPATPHCPRGCRSRLVARLFYFDLRRRRICRLARRQVRGRADMGWHCRGDRGDRCRLGRGTAGSQLCAQAYQTPRSSADHPRSPSCWSAFARAKNRRRRRKFYCCTERKRFARTRSRSTSVWSTCLAFLARRPVARRRTSGPSGRRHARGASWPLKD